MIRPSNAAELARHEKEKELLENYVKIMEDKKANQNEFQQNKIDALKKIEEDHVIRQLETMVCQNEMRKFIDEDAKDRKNLDVTYQENDLRQPKEQSAGHKAGEAVPELSPNTVQDYLFSTAGYVYGLLPTFSLFSMCSCGLNSEKPSEKRMPLNPLCQNDYGSTSTVKVTF